MRRVRRAGDNAVIIDCGTLDNALRTFELLRDLPADEIVPAAETVLVIGMDEAALLALLDAPIHTPLTSTPDLSDTTVTIPVVYDGVDLQDVADLTGVSPDAVIERHTSAEYTVAFTGFAPGFAYLTGGDGALEVSRRSSPRQRIPAGSVGLAGEFSGIYPRESPGGWQLIGRTSHQMWDLSRSEPAALIPGYSVRFEATREAVTLGPRAQDNAHEPVNPVAHALTITNPGIQTLIEDLGRPGHAHQGVSPSGAADRTALRDANRLVGNAPGAAALEISLGDVEATVTTTTVMAVCGAERNGVIVGKRKIPHGRAFRVDAGDRILLPSPERGLRTVLAIRGGIEVPETLGSRSTDTLSGLGPQSPTDIHVHAGAHGLTGEPAASRRLPAAGEVTELRVIPGPRDDWFEPGQFDREWEVTAASSRVGIRMSGTPFERRPGYIGRELPSEGLVTGAIQVPADGQPVLFLADRPLTGGYPVIGVVVEDDLDLAAQLPPGAVVRFIPVDSQPVHEGEF